MNTTPSPRDACLDPAPDGAGWLQRAPAGWKLAGTLGLITVTTLMPAGQHWWFAAVAGFLGLAAAASGIRAGVLLRRLALLLPLVMGTVLLAWLRPAGGPPWWLLAARSGLSLTAVVLLSLSTTPSALLRVLQRLRLPAVLLTTLTLMHRYLFVLRDESGRMQRAALSRTFRPRRLAWGAPASVVGRLFIRASERAERIYAAMCARGWQ